MDASLESLPGDRRLLRLESEHPDECAGGGLVGLYSFAGASVVGRMHAHEGRGRDDAWAVSVDGNWFAVGVSDGAGSRPKSRVGAAYVVSRLTQRLVALANRRGKLLSQGSPVGGRGHSGLGSVMRRAFGETHRGLEEFAKRRGVSLEELHCTLLGMVLNVETGEFAAGQIGDGLIIGLNQERDAVALVEPPATGDPGASYFITQKDWKRCFAAKEKNANEATAYTTFYLMTDGVSSDCQYGPPPDILRRWARDMDREVRMFPSASVTAQRLRRYLAGYRVQGSFDDRTLVVVYRQAGI